MDAIRIKNLRSLIDTGEIPLKPLTVLVGRNSSGKSTFLRAFPLLRQSIETATTSPILWYGKYVDFGSFSDALNLTDSENGEIRFAFALPWPPVLGLATRRWRFSPLEPTEVRAEVAICSAGRRQDSRIGSCNIRIGEEDEIRLAFSEQGNVASLHVNSKEFSEPQGSLTVREQGSFLPVITPKVPAATRYRSWLAGPTGPRIRAAYTPAFMSELVTALKPLFHGNTLLTTMREVAADIRLARREEFRAHLGSVHSSKHWRNSVAQASQYLLSLIRDCVLACAVPPILEHVDDAVGAFGANVRYMGPLRATSERYYRPQDLAVDELDFRGANLAMFLRSHTPAQKKSFTDFCSEYLGFRVNITEGEGQVAVNLQETQGKQSINLADMGFGYSQILPVVAQVWNSLGQSPTPRRPSEEPCTLAIEQPELHLHPAYQARIADIFVGAMKAARDSQRPVSIIAETHSESLVNRIGELIEAGKIDAESVQILVFEQKESPFETDVSIASFDKSGALQNWPFGFFTDGREAARNAD